jgi:hypothetical protein
VPLPKSAAKEDQMRRSFFIPMALFALVTACEPPDDSTETTNSNIRIGEETPVNTRNMLLLAKAAICGPGIWGPGVGGFPFEARKATINTFDGQVTFVAGHLNHIINFWPDDHMDYTIRYEDGKPQEPKIEITHGGVAAWLKVIADVVVFAGLDKMKIGEGKDAETKELKPDKLAEIATSISHIVQGRGWEAQAAAEIDLIGWFATKGNMICSFDIL